MSITLQVSNLATRIGTEFKNTKNMIGVLANLTTTAKNNTVAAINEVKALADTKTSVNDAAENSSNTWSSSKIASSIAAAKAEILGGAASAYDTLLEIQQALQSDDSDISGLLTAVANRVRFDAAQSLSAPQQQQAQDNIGVYSRTQIGDPTTNFVTIFEAALL